MPLARPPASATGALTGIAGVVTLLAAASLLREWLAPSYVKALAVVALVAAAMIAADVVLYRVHRGASTGLASRPIRPLDPGRVGRKCLGLSATLVAAALPYWVIPEFARDYFAPFRNAALFLLPGLVVVAPIYIAYVDRRQDEPEDGCAQLGALILGRTPRSWSDVALHARGWAIKAFFLPLMFVYVTNDLVGLWTAPFLPSPLDFEHIFPRLLDLLYLIDVLLAVIAYALTLRVVDSHIRSVEPMLGGWLVCLICYPPFNGVTGHFLQYDQDGLFWGKVFAPWPALYVLWGSVILFLVAVYAWSTAAFGLRFSNLTNRGIITNGPYRWTRHPAYICKNLSWWMISVPFIAGAGWPQAVQSCLLLGGVNLIYFVRARTEERHLGADPAYVAYSEFIRQHGLFAVAHRAVAGIAARSHGHMVSWASSVSLGQSRESGNPD